MTSQKPVVVVAELSGNHGNDLARTRDTLQAMAEAGADAIKLQTYRAESLTLDLDTGPFRPRSSGPWKGRTAFDVFTEGTLPYEWHEELFAMAASLGMQCFSSPFDVEGVDFLEGLGTPTYKVASFEIRHVPLLERIAATRKPVIVSTGIASLADIELALDVLGRERDDITLLKCTSAYPTPVDEVDLLTIPTLRAAFGVDVGLSDHTMGHVVPVAAVALGATLIEKHFVLDRTAGGIDASFSLEPHEFKQMVEAVRVAEAALGSSVYRLGPASQAASSRGRSIFVAKHVARGETLTEDNLRVVRPGDGLHPIHYSTLLGRSVRVDVEAGTPLSWDLVE
jgi:pseudaminic acid synthase